MTLEQFQQVNARLREYFDPVQLPEWWSSRQPLLDDRFAIDCSYHEVMRLIDQRSHPGTAAELICPSPEVLNATPPPRRSAIGQPSIWRRARWVSQL